MQRVISFGKVAYTGNRKSYEVTLEIELDYKDKNKPVFSVCGNVWNTHHTDIVMGGQCIDGVWQEYKHQLHKPVLYKKIMGLWQRNHLNDLQAGCIHQRMLQWDNRYISEKCPYCGYKYGTAWLYKPIPFRDLYAIKKLLGIALNAEEKAIAEYIGLESGVKNNA